MSKYQNEQSRIDGFLQEERDKCKADVCMYCGGRAKGYDRTPKGPNSAGNWEHDSVRGPAGLDSALCRASAIFSRERAEANRQVF